ncbi:MAG TPA: Uma2 family endonuclease [Longimicrobium sp.]|nr:Uma2 family endonuclease [Longimicrobium sp.]
MTAGAPGVVIPRTDDGWPLADMQVVGEVLERFPDLRMSFEEYLTLDEDFFGEWIDGQVEIRPCQGRAHHEAMGFLSVAFRWYVDRTDPRDGTTLRGFVMRPSGLPARMVDLLYVAPEHEDRIKHVFVDGPADIVVEVVEDESRHRDTVEKFREYERGGVRGYWIVDPVRKEAQVWRLIDGRYEPMPLGDPPALRSEVLEGLWILPEWIWEDRDRFEVMREWGFEIPPRRRRHT